MLDKLFKITYDQGVKCFKLTAYFEHTKNPYSFIYEFMKYLMDFDSSDTVAQRERLISSTLQEYAISNLYFALNPVLKTTFPTPVLTDKVREKLPQVTQKLFRLLVGKLITHLQVHFLLLVGVFEIIFQFHSLFRFFSSTTLNSRMPTQFYYCQK